jgi:hypothetical protein
MPLSDFGADEGGADEDGADEDGPVVLYGDERQESDDEYDDEYAQEWGAHQSGDEDPESVAPEAEEEDEPEDGGEEEEYEEGEEEDEYEEGEEEDEYEECGELKNAECAEDAEDADQSSSNKKQKIVHNDVLLTQNQRLHGRVRVLEDEVEKLKTEKRLLEEASTCLREKNTALQKDTEAFQGRVNALNAALAALASSPIQPLPYSGTVPCAVPPTAVALNKSVRNVVLGMVLRTPSGRPLHEVPVPFRFPDTGAFPHAIDKNVRTKLREYQVEQRRIVNFVFSAKFDDGSSATEHDISPSGFVPYKMQFLYADDGTDVNAGDFTRVSVDSLCHPNADLISERNMTNGELVFRINRFNVASTDTSPRHREFMVRVAPTDPELAKNQNLVVTSPPFVIRAKVTAPKPATGTTAASEAVAIVHTPSAQ